MSNFELVKQFHKQFGHPINNKPDLIAMDRAHLRVSLIQEELDELREAILDRDIIEIADALGDLDYVVCGAAAEYGIPLDKCVEEIHRSNMTKLGEDGKPIYRQDGKIMKGPNYEKPNLLPILEDN